MARLYAVDVEHLFLGSTQTLQLIIIITALGVTRNIVFTAGHQSQAQITYALTFPKHK